LRPLPRAPNEKYHVHVRHPCALSEPRSYLAGRPESRQMFSDGKAYERLMGRWSQPVGEAFLDWLDGPQGVRCSDIGCGNGAFTEVLVKRCAPASVAAIDPSEGQLAYARKRPTTTMVQFRQSDSQALPYADGSFDAVAMALVITFIPDAAKAIAEMAR